MASLNISKKLFIMSSYMLCVGLISYFFYTQYKFQNDALSHQRNVNHLLANVEKTVSAQTPAGTGDLEKRLARLESKLKKIDMMFGPGGLDAIGSKQNAPQRDMTVYDIPVTHSPVVGDPDAPITIVEFVDFECPFCSRYYSVLPELVDKYPDRVNYMIKNFPLTFQKQAVPAAKAALAAAEQGKYREMLRALFDNRKELSPEKYVQLSKDIGLDPEKFSQDLQDNDKRYNAYIHKDLELGKHLGVKGTPTFFINGRQTGARDLPSFEKEIEALLDN